MLLLKYGGTTMKKTVTIILFAIFLIAVLAITGCSSDTASESNDTAATEVTVEGLTEAIAEQPVLLTSVGQSADVEMVKTMLSKSDIKLTMDAAATAEDLGDAKTLILAVGGSSKGLGAAGIDANQELERVSALIDAADEAGLTIIAVHIGGEARRGELSDKFIPPSFEKADYAIVVSTGDQDGLMKGLASDAGIPMDVVDTMADVIAPLKAAFK
jgi:hypothetical protein